LDQQFRISTVEISQTVPVDKPAPAVRDRLPNRRPAETMAFERGNLNYHMTVGLYPDGRVGEIFLSAEHSNSLLDALTHDAAILASLALQFGCPLDTIRHAIKRDSRGEAASPIGADGLVDLMSQKPAPLAEPIEISKFWKDRRRDTAIVVSLNSYERHNLVNVREHFVGSDGCMRPTTKGLSMVVRRLPELSRAIRHALERARELDLLPEEATSGDQGEST
jgi:hypothetical protein